MCCFAIRLPFVELVFIVKRGTDRYTNYFYVFYCFFFFFGIGFLCITVFPHRKKIKKTKKKNAGKEPI